MVVTRLSEFLLSQLYSLMTTWLITSDVVLVTFFMGWKVPFSEWHTGNWKVVLECEISSQCWILEACILCKDVQVTAGREYPFRVESTQYTTTKISSQPTRSFVEVVFPLSTARKLVWLCRYNHTNKGITNNIVPLRETGAETVEPKVLEYAGWSRWIVDMFLFNCAKGMLHALKGHQLRVGCRHHTGELGCWGAGVKCDWSVIGKITR